MEAQLAEYRRRKAKSENRPTASLFKRIQKYILGDDAASETRKNETQNPLVHALENSDIIDSTDYFKEKGLGSKYFRLETGLKVVLWLLLWGLFIHLQFGAVYFCVSLLIIIYATMKSGSRDKKKLSAYSVFNPNFERLDGTFTAEQFEKELRFGAGSVR